MSMCHTDGEFWVERQQIDTRARSDSLFPRLAVAGGPRALALVHRGGLLLGRHPRQGHQRHQTHQTATSGSAGLRGWLGRGTIGARGLQGGFSASPFGGRGPLFCPQSSSQTHFRIVDSSWLNPSWVYVLLRGRWLHWAPGGRSRRRRGSGAPAAAVLTRAGSQRALGWHHSAHHHCQH